MSLFSVSLVEFIPSGTQPGRTFQLGFFSPSSYGKQDAQHVIGAADE